MNEEAVIKQEDMFTIVGIIRTMIKLEDENKSSYEKVFAKIKGQVKKGPDIVFNSYDIYWIKKACEFLLPGIETENKKIPESHRFKQDVQKIISFAGRLAHLDNDKLDHVIEDGHSRNV